VVPDAAEIRLAAGQAGNGVISRLHHGGQNSEEHCGREHRDLERTGHVVLLCCKSRNFYSIVNLETYLIHTTSAEGVPDYGADPGSNRSN
jgi:hypothetical protein